MSSQPPPLESSSAPIPSLAVGERIEGTLVEVGLLGRIALADGRFVNIDSAELAAGSGSLETGEAAAVEVGSALSAFVVRVDAGGEVWVSRSKDSAALLLLLNARDHGEVIQGRVAAQGPGGLEIDLGGGIFATCPPEEIGTDVDNPGHLVGQMAFFKVLEATAARVTLSRRRALEAIAQDADDAPAPTLTDKEKEVRAEEAAEVRRRLRPGAIMAGRITKLREFGVFVDLGGGVEGLIHLSELSHDRVASPKDVVRGGQPVEVQVLKVDYDAHKGERIALSLKALSKSAWDAALAEIKEGDKRAGKVTRLESFGAFVELLPGITGLIHVSALSAKRNVHPSDFLKAGDEVQVEVIGVDKAKRRIALKRTLSEAELAEKKAGQAAFREQKRAEARAKREEARKKPHERLQPGQILDAVVDRMEPYGFFLQLKGGGRGMVHVSEMGPAPEGVDTTKPLAEQFPKGAKVKVAVLEIDAEHRIRLSRLAVPELEKGTTAEGYLKHKVQHELEERLLRSAAKPARPRAERGQRPPTKPRVPRADQAAPAGAEAAARSERPRRDGARPRPGPTPTHTTKSGVLGTLGDLLKAKLQQRKT